MDIEAAPDGDSLEEPQSPYSANRNLIQSLTLPTVPNVDIPPSPEGSPPRGVTKKFEQFLSLKKKGTHFNAKLENSQALKNPSLMDTLLEFVQVDAAAQYETTLPTMLWNPQGFPEWASVERLKRTREKVVKEREMEQASGTRSSVDFVPALAAASTSTPPGGISKGERSRTKGGRN
jgi:hypothetical protein